MRILLTGLLLCLVMPLKAQYNFAFMPEIQGRTMDGIFKVRIGNTGTKQIVSLSIIVTEAKSGAVVTIKTPAFELMPGMNSAPAYSAAVAFGDSKLATGSKSEWLLSGRRL